jgi:hypothetical protein
MVSMDKGVQTSLLSNGNSTTFKTVEDIIRHYRKGSEYVSQEERDRLIEWICMRKGWNTSVCEKWSDEKVKDFYYELIGESE